MHVTNVLAGPVERVAAAPGTPWNTLAVIVSGQAPSAAPIGVVAPGDTDCGTFWGDALDGVIDVRQLRREPVPVRLALERVDVGDAGGSLDRLDLVADVALDGSDRWRGLCRGLRMLDPRASRNDAADTALAEDADAIDRHLADAMGAALESYVRDALARADVGSARDGALAHIIAPSTPVAIGGSFSVRALRVSAASWAVDRLSDPHRASTSALREVPTDPSAPADGTELSGDDALVIDVEADTGEVMVADAQQNRETAELELEPESAARDGDIDTGPVALPANVADAPLERFLGSSPVLATAWASETDGDPVAAIGGVVHEGDATVIVLHPNPEQVVLSGRLFDALGAALHVGTPRLLVLPAADSLRALLEHWLAEQAPPAGIESALVIDDLQRRVVLELSGDRAAEFVERVAESGRVDLAALGAVLPWSISLRAVGEHGLVEADGTGLS